MRRVELSALPVALALTLAGCQQPRGCVEHCSAPSDAGSETADLPLPPACPAQRICPHLDQVHTNAMIVPLGDANRGTVSLGNGVYTPLGPAVSWLSVPLDPGAPPHAGVALLLRGKVAAFVENVPPNVHPEAPVLFQRDDELDLLLPPNYDRVVRVPLDTFVPSAPVVIPLSGAPQEAPAVLGIGQVVAAVTQPGPRLVFVDSSFGERLLDEPIAAGNALTATCNGLLVIGAYPGRAEAFNTVGRATGPLVTWKPGPAWHPIWDGASVVVETTDSIVELASNGTVRSVTPAARGTTVAVGTDDGILAATIVNGPTVLRLLQRGTGAVLEEHDNFSGQVAVAGDRAVYFASGSGYAGSVIHWVWVTCKD